MFGKVLKKKSINEITPFHPRSMYGVSKVFAYHTTVIIGKHTDYMLAMVFYLITSPKKGCKFCNKKNCSRISENKKRKTKKTIIRKLYAIRDWGHAKDYVESMWKILQ